MNASNLEFSFLRQCFSHQFREIQDLDAALLFFSNLGGSQVQIGLTGRAGGDNGICPDLQGLQGPLIGDLSGKFVVEGLQAPSASAAFGQEPVILEFDQRSLPGLS